MSGKLSNSPVRSAEASRLPQANSRNRYPNALPDLHWDAVQRSDFTGDRCETRCTLELQVGKWPGIDFSIAREDISSETDWKILDNRHTVVVHLNGPIHKLETELDGSGGTHEPPMSGELWIIPAERRYFSCARGAIVHFAEVYLQPKFLDELLGKHVDTQTVRARTGHYDHFLYHCVQRLASLIGKKDDVSQMTAHSLSQTLFLHFFSEYTLGSDRGTIAQNTVALSSSEGQLLREYIHERLSEHISLDDLAALVKMKTHDLLMAFPRSFGNTPAQYVIEQRLRRARWLLSETNMDIARIALETGFASHSHLTTTFRTRVGLTPHQFRLSKRIA